eukprot:scaffold379464_cov21-Prasinocladus_malaysianus.AAC.1
MGAASARLEVAFADWTGHKQFLACVYDNCSIAGIIFVRSLIRNIATECREETVFRVSAMYDILLAFQA